MHDAITIVINDEQKLYCCNLKLAKIFLKSENVKEALKHTQVAIQADPSNKESFEIQGDANMLDKNWDKAIISYQTAIRNGNSGRSIEKNE